MAIPVQAFGFVLSTIYSNALKQTPGTQASYYSTNVVSALGTAPILQIEVDGVIKYKAVIPALSASSAGITLPETTSAPTVNVPDTLASNNVFLKIVSAASPFDYLKIKLAKGPFLGVGDAFAITAALDGTSVFKTKGVILGAPAGLDVVAGSLTTPTTGVLASHTMMIEDMSLDNDALCIPENGSSLGLVKARSVCPSYDSLVDMTLGGRGLLAQGVNAIIPIVRVWEAATNTATNAKVSIRNLEVFIFHKLLNTWVVLNKGIRVKGTIVTGASGNGTIGNLAFDEDGESTSCTPAANAYELTPESLFLFNNRDFVTSARAVHVRCQMRVQRIDPLSTDDRANARFYANVGFEWADSFNNSGLRPPNFFPIAAMDGGNGRSKMVPYDVPTLTSGDWTMFSYTSLPSFENVQTPQPWGNGTTPWAYDAAPWVLTTTQFNTTKPTLP